MKHESTDQCKIISTDDTKKWNSWEGWNEGGSGKETTFPCDVSDLYADQRSQVRGYDNS